MRTLALTGSLAVRSSPVQPDLDLVVLTPTVNIGQVVDTNLIFGGMPTTITAYNDFYFRAIAKNPELTFFHLREARKLAFSSLLMDDGSGVQTIHEIFNAKVSRKWLKNLMHKAELYPACDQHLCFDIEFFSALETLVLVTMSVRVSDKYSKHKYLLEDAAFIEWSSLVDLLRVLSEPLETASFWPQLATDFQGLLKMHPSSDPGVTLVADDAVALVSHGLTLAAVLPFRHALLRYHLNRDRAYSPMDTECHPLIQQGLSLGRPLPIGIQKLFRGCCEQTSIAINRYASE